MVAVLTFVADIALGASSTPSSHFSVGLVVVGAELTALLFRRARTTAALDLTSWPLSTAPIPAAVLLVRDTVVVVAARLGTGGSARLGSADRVRIIGVAAS